MTQVCDHEEPCACYVEGYAQGREKAHFEVRNALENGHSDQCGCEPCKTFLHVATQLAMRWSTDA